MYMYIYVFKVSIALLSGHFEEKFTEGFRTRISRISGEKARCFDSCLIRTRILISA